VIASVLGKMEATMNPEISYYVYVRKSSESEYRQVASIPAQIEELKKIAQKNELKVIDTFVEEKSAKEPGLIGSTHSPVKQHLNKEVHNASIQRKERADQIPLF
jgi:hypothetical protein